MKKLCVLLLAACLAMSLLAGCGGGTEETVNVQSVSMICGLGGAGIPERFAGMVSARSEINVKPTDKKTIGEIMVSEGDEVSEGQVLFTYDMEVEAINLEKANLEMEQLKNGLAAKEKEKAQLEKDRDKASSDKKLSYTLEIQQCDTDIREQNYNITLKEQELARLEASLNETDYKAPFSGRVKALNPEGGFDTMGNELPFMTLLESGSYRVKGFVNESNVGALYEGTEVIIRSRMDDTVTWSGSVSMIDWENPAKSNNNMYYADDGTSEMTSTSKYPFYIELNDSEGLLLGQHVYIEPDYGQDVVQEDVIALPAYYLAGNEGASGTVWARDAKGRLEKREVGLGEYDEMMETYVITSGLTEDDYIAFPEEGLKEGMTCVEFDESAFEVEGGEEFYNGMEPGMATVEEMGGMPFEEGEPINGEFSDGGPEEPIDGEFSDGGPEEPIDGEFPDGEPEEPVDGEFGESEGEPVPAGGAAG